MQIRGDTSEPPWSESCGETIATSPPPVDYAAPHAISPSPAFPHPRRTQRSESTPRGVARTGSCKALCQHQSIEASATDTNRNVWQFAVFHPMSSKPHQGTEVSSARPLEPTAARKEQPVTQAPGTSRYDRTTSKQSKDTRTQWPPDREHPPEIHPGPPAFSLKRSSLAKFVLLLSSAGRRFVEKTLPGISNVHDRPLIGEGS